MTGPTPEQRAEWRRDASDHTRALYGGVAYRRILALLDALEEAEKRAESWKAQCIHLQEISVLRESRP